MNYRSLFKLVVLAGVAVVTVMMVSEAVKEEESLCTWESATVSGSTAEVKVWRKDVEKKVSR